MASIRERELIASNTIDTWAGLEKHILQSISVEKRMIIAVKLLHVNADPVIRCNFETDSNAIAVSDL
jgi:hypothetical protein